MQDQLSPSPNYRRLGVVFCAFMAVSFSPISVWAAAPAKTPAKPPAAKATGDTQAKTTADQKNANATLNPQPILENVISVNAEDLVNKPNDFLNKNVKFTADFAGFSALALDYKPALRSSKTHLSLLIFRNGTKIPLSELKLAMMIPKEKDPENLLLATLKEGDKVELVGKEFSTALDDPWVEIFQLKKLGGTDDKKDDKKTASSDDGKTLEHKANVDQGKIPSGTDKKTFTTPKPDVIMNKKPAGSSTSKPKNNDKSQ
jgi:hypothetical protein